MKDSKYHRLHLASLAYCRLPLFERGGGVTSLFFPDQTRLFFPPFGPEIGGCSPKNGEKNLGKEGLQKPPHELHCQCHANFNRWNCYKECLNEERGGVQRAQWAARSILLWLFRISSDPSFFTLHLMENHWSHSWIYVQNLHFSNQNYTYPWFSA